MAKSLPFRGAGNINLKGKREALLACKCCVITDLRPKFRDIEHRKEMNDPDLNR